MCICHLGPHYENQALHRTYSCGKGGLIVTPITPYINCYLQLNVVGASTLCSISASSLDLPLKLRMLTLFVSLFSSCFASAFSNPFGKCNWIPRACVHCYLAVLGHCERDISAHPGMEYPGNSTPSLQPRGSHQAEQAHLTVVGGDSPGLIHSEERVVDPVMTHGWVTAMQVLWHLRHHQLVSSILWVLQLFVECHDCYTWSASLTSL